MKKFLSQKAGVTLLEGLIAIALLALVASGTFGVLLSISRTSDQPDRREDMMYAVDELNDILKSNAYIMQNPEENAPDYVQLMLCVPAGNLNSSAEPNVRPLSILSGDAWHNVDCLLPPSCDRNNSSFAYQVYEEDISFNNLSSLPSYMFQNANIIGSQNPNSTRKITSRRIRYKIVCNGYTL